MKNDSVIPGWRFKRSREWSILIPALISVIALIRVLTQPSWLSVTALIISVPLLALILYFFRNPERSIERAQNKFFSPGDGVVRDIENQNYAGHYYTRIGIFLSVLDVHIQRAPIAGEISFVEHQYGKNHPAFDPQASSENEQIIMGIQSSYGLIIVKQIAGILARRCVNYAQKGDPILSGQRYGLIKFGSRVELYLPVEAEICCEIGDKVYGGKTVLAVKKDDPP
jgi:phosphatidylserine decarboxylase